MKARTGFRIGLLVVLAAGLVGLGWLMNRHKLWERWATFQRMPVFGKSWANEVDKMQNLYPTDSVDYLFLGDSHMEQCEWQEFFPQKKVANRGIGGETTTGLLQRIDALPPCRLVFLQIGINDLLGGQPPESVFDRYQEVLYKLEKRHAKVVPCLVFYTRYSPDVNPSVRRLNELLRAWFQKENRDFISLNPELAEGETLKQAYTLDGIHLNAQGYQVWLRQLQVSLGQMEAGSR
jgi:lysophospholipase L1-like esterase